MLVIILHLNLHVRFRHSDLPCFVQQEFPGPLWRPATTKSEIVQVSSLKQKMFPLEPGAVWRLQVSALGVCRIVVFPASSVVLLTRVGYQSCSLAPVPRGARKRAMSNTIMLRGRGSGCHCSKRKISFKSWLKQNQWSIDHSSLGKQRQQRTLNYNCTNCEHTVGDLHAHIHENNLTILKAETFSKTLTKTVKKMRISQGQGVLFLIADPVSFLVNGKSDERNAWPEKI